MTRPRLLLCSIDGMRPDGLDAASTPTLDRLRREGAYTGRARTVMPSVTLPAHTSMLRGVDTARHGITTNMFQPLARPVPSVLDVAHAAGKRTGFFYNWEELRDLAAPGSLNASVLWGDCDTPGGDRRVADLAAQFAADTDFDFLFVYFGYTDISGHAHGWMSNVYLDAIVHADSCLAVVLNALENDGRATNVLVLSDHGGHERSHGTNCDEDMRIPYLLHGPDVKRGCEISDGVRIYDTAPTVAHLLGVPPPSDWEGRVILEALTGA